MPRKRTLLIAGVAGLIAVGVIYTLTRPRGFPNVLPSLPDFFPTPTGQTEMTPASPRAPGINQSSRSVSVPAPISKKFEPTIAAALEAATGSTTPSAGGTVAFTSTGVAIQVPSETFAGVGSGAGFTGRQFVSGGTPFGGSL